MRYGGMTVRNLVDRHVNDRKLVVGIIRARVLKDSANGALSGFQATNRPSSPRRRYGLFVLTLLMKGLPRDKHR
jgi:hypothetical protein